jgi:hypothetical protein
MDFRDFLMRNSKGKIEAETDGKRNAALPWHVGGGRLLVSEKRRIRSAALQKLAHGQGAPLRRGRSASVRISPPGNAWERINFFLPPALGSFRLRSEATARRVGATSRAQNGLKNRPGGLRSRKSGERPPQSKMLAQDLVWSKIQCPKSKVGTRNRRQMFRCKSLIFHRKWQKVVL